jgi:hypothetical protein
MFQFSAFALHPYAFRVKYPCGWVAPFGNPRITARLPAPLGLSQVPASFIASRHQDIHHVPLCSVIPTGRRGLAWVAPDCSALTGWPTWVPLREGPPISPLIHRNSWLIRRDSTFALRAAFNFLAAFCSPTRRPLREPAETPAWQSTTTLPPIPQYRLGDMFIRIRLSKSRHLCPGFPGFRCRFHPSASRLGVGSSLDRTPRQSSCRVSVFSTLPQVPSRQRLATHPRRPAVSVPKRRRHLLRWRRLVQIPSAAAQPPPPPPPPPRGAGRGVGCSRSRSGNWRGRGRGASSTFLTSPWVAPALADSDTRL